MPEVYVHLLYVKLIQCSCIPRSMVNWRRGALVYVHFPTCETSLV